MLCSAIGILLFWWLFSELPVDFFLFWNFAVIFIWESSEFYRQHVSVVASTVFVVSLACIIKVKTGFIPVQFTPEITFIVLSCRKIYLNPVFHRMQLPGKLFRFHLSQLWGTGALALISVQLIPIKCEWTMNFMANDFFLLRMNIQWEYWIHTYVAYIHSVYYTFWLFEDYLIYFTYCIRIAWKIV